MSDKEKTNSACKCEEIKKIVIAMCDVNQRRDRIVKGSLACVTFCALMHENFPKFPATQQNNSFCDCPECGAVLCTCNCGFEVHDDPEEYADLFPTSNGMDRFQVKQGE